MPTLTLTLALTHTLTRTHTLATYRSLRRRGGISPGAVLRSLPSWIVV